MRTVIHSLVVCRDYTEANQKKKTLEEQLKMRVKLYVLNVCSNY